MNGKSKKPKRKADLIRGHSRRGAILGTLITDQFNTYSVLELEWRNNQQNVSCIPAGEYECSFIAQSASGKYKDVYHVRDVPGRLGILIHNGNLASHTRGCLILGLRKGVLAGKPAVLSSRTAMRRLVNEMGQDRFILKIWGNHHVRNNS